MTLKRKLLHRYQKRAVKFIKKKRRVALFLDMGLGKTVITLTAALDMLAEGQVNRVIVIAPLRVANTVWGAEIENWAHLKGLTYGIATGTEENRHRVLISRPQILIINREQIAWLVQKVANTWPWDMIIIDESSSFKEQSTKRFSYLRKMIVHTRSVVLLSGTPAPNGYVDLWAQYYLLDQGKRLGRLITFFRDRYCTLDPYSRKWRVRDKYHRKKILKKIKDITLSMKSEDYLDLPPCIYLTEYVEAPKKALKQYETMKKEFVLSLEGGVDIEAEYAASLSAKLLQMCNGFIYENFEEVQVGKFDDEGDPIIKKWTVPHAIHDGKVERLKEIMTDNANENFFIAYNFKEDKARLKAAFPECVFLSKDGRELDDWNKGKIKMLAVHPASAGHGLNAQFGGSVVVWFGLTWSLEYYQQLNKRLHRQGQTKTVRIIHLIAKGWLDEIVMRALTSKARTQDEILEYVKADMGVKAVKKLKKPKKKKTKKPKKSKKKKKIKKSKKKGKKNGKKKR